MVTLTKGAESKLRDLIAAEDLPTCGLRVQVIPGGCSGFEYSLALASAEDGDEVVDQEGARIFIDRLSIPYLIGAEFDYEESFQGAGFIIKNPNADSSCGCGKSFTA